MEGGSGGERRRLPRIVHRVPAPRCWPAWQGSWAALRVVPRFCSSCRPPAASAPWPTCMQEVLRDQGSLFEQVGKTPTGKIVWKLSEAATAEAQR